jgi:hypothetical protein
MIWFRDYGAGSNELPKLMDRNLILYRLRIGKAVLDVKGDLSATPFGQGVSQPLFGRIAIPLNTCYIRNTIHVVVGACGRH